MDDYLNEPDVPSLVALIVFVSLWGVFTCAAALKFAALAIF
jgi:hypothetical protein